MMPARTCIGCRRRDDRSALLRVVARDGAVILDPRASLPGRGAWVHRTSECMAAAVQRKAFGRALRAADMLDTSGLAAFEAIRPPVTEQAETPMDH